ncbi:hypothetical protein [Paractinoplanes durhamensis]
MGFEHEIGVDPVLAAPQLDETGRVDGATLSSYTFWLPSPGGRGCFSGFQ